MINIVFPFDVSTLPDIPKDVNETDSTTGIIYVEMAGLSCTFLRLSNRL